MSFFTLPPEINSLRMFLGAGSAPMLEAAAAWDGLAAELGSAADSFGSVISNLASQAWQGPAAAAMAAAAAPYAGWLAAAASQSLGAAGQARTVVSAFEAARAATVHPGAVDANRNAFVQLVMSNLFGQNAPLIAMAESIYEEMWAADVTAMTGYYAGAAAAAAQVVPWQTVLQSFPALTGGIAGAVGALANSAGAGTGAGAAPVGPVGAQGGGGGGGGDAAGAAAGGGGGSSAGGVASGGGGESAGAAPVSYTNGYTGGGDAAGAGSAAATTANTGVGSPGVVSPGGVSPMAGLGMLPMAMAGLSRAGLLGDSPSMPVPAKAQETEKETEEVTPDEVVEAPEAETPEVEVPAMSVLPSAASDIAAKAAPGEERPAAASATTGATGIPETGLRAATPAQETEEVSEAEENVATLRPKIAPGEFHSRGPAAEEEAPKIQIRGG
ncbi:hypothetical protein A5634_15080 [Mycobacterium asiaticum]|uniref:PPE domain-containing protein n=1 Tax=Mycobacterium asiaticum TaxID=1790 RepID=A0A1A3PA99_MYCAS|nr:PPE family protein [Mycobacterium asiaticum]OBK30620.1 hypothetical protein A5634_15080 [Mycobacterium asiaticum]